MVPPLEFVPLAEETGLIQAIGRWVLGEACREAVSWNGRGVPISIGVNVSPEQLKRATFSEDVALALAKSGLRPDLLTLELTESLVLLDTETTMARLAELKELGVKLAIDDFGTGYASLSYLRKFPLDILKVDRSFVSGIGKDPGASALGCAIVRLGHTVGLSVVAEGIEEKKQADVLRGSGCELGQGYYFGRPVHALGFLQFLETAATGSAPRYEQPVNVGLPGLTGAGTTPSTSLLRPRR
jgi:EAL domain-containing protein (putative c-di-GMP-specific phosphodiesterase class I)